MNVFFYMNYYFNGVFLEVPKIFFCTCVFSGTKSGPNLPNFYNTTTTLERELVSLDIRLN